MATILSRRPNPVQRAAKRDLAKLQEALPGAWRARDAEGKPVSALTEIVGEGDPFKAVIVVGAGRLEITQSGPYGRGAVREAGPGDAIGLVEVVSGARTWTTKVRALTSSRIVAVSVAEVRKRAETCDGGADRLAELAEAELRERLLANVGALTLLDGSERRWLASRMRHRQIRAGEVVIAVGDTGETCAVVRTGRLAIEVPGHGEVEQIGAGEIVGEIAALTGRPRSATVRALEDSELLELEGEDLRELSRRGQAAEGVLHLAAIRRRPRRAVGVEVHEREDGSAILHLRRSVVWFRLTERGRWLWSQLDGARTVRELALAEHAEFGTLDPQGTVALVQRLERAGLLDDARPAAPLVPSGRFSRVAAAMRRLVFVHTDLPEADRWFDRLHRMGGRVLTSRVGVTMVGALAVLALVLLAVELVNGARTLAEQRLAHVALLFPAAAVGLAIHEMGHGLAVKRFGRSVVAAGIGLYWLRPTAYVDTSEMWLQPRHQRVLVSAAGPLASLALAGALALIADLCTDAETAGAVWAAALPAYFMGLINLSPVLDLDGYHMLSDLTDRPNLRDEAFARARGEAPRGGGEARRAVDFAYVAGSVASVGVLVATSLFAWRIVLERWLDAVMPETLAVWLAWSASAASALFAILVLVAAFRGDGEDVL